MEGKSGLKRILGLDYGSRTVGVAVSDALGITAQVVETIHRTSENKLRRTLARIKQISDEYGVELIVLGLPLNMNGDMSDRARKSLEFKEMLEKRTGLSVVTWDERLTTIEAEEILKEAGVKRQDMKQHVDKIAAAIILQDYLDNV